ncbi:MAG: ribonuclease H-like domain-containing protein [Verrucomicrobia bacterium]|nr:ribonuclease H-like domain-containing protein [Verrucomicrobiota bacterium]
MSLTSGALRHLPGIGPEREKRLRASGIRTWDDLLRERPGHLPGLGITDRLHDAVQQSREALNARDLGALTGLLARADHWRLLHDFAAEATYLDIETTGQQQAEITVVVCLHRGELHTFVQGENLDMLLDLLDDTRLLVTFNGASFDLPQIVDYFHIPPLTLPHIDLRWVCYHAGLSGGLKHIERAVGIQRPHDLVGTDGAEAVWLWDRWCTTRQPELRTKLLRYCAADVIALDLLREQLLERILPGSCPARPVRTNADLWRLLPEQDAVIQPAVKGLGPLPSASPLSQRHARLREHLRHPSR